MEFTLVMAAGDSLSVAFDVIWFTNARNMAVALSILPEEINASHAD